MAVAAGPRPTAKPSPKPTPSKLASPKPADGHVLQGGAAGQVVDRHQLERLAAEHPPAVELAAVGQHLAEGDVVVGGRDQAARSREIGARAAGSRWRTAPPSGAGVLAGRYW